MRPTSSPRIAALDMRIACLLALAAVAACAPADTPPGSGPPDGWPVEIRCVSLPLEPGDGGAAVLGRLRYRAGLALTADHRQFGGFSGLAVSADGRRLAAVSDRGHWLFAELAHGSDGALTAVAAGRLGPLREADGRPVAGRWRRDAEELAELPNRGYLVTFEGHHRASLYAGSVERSGAPPAGVPEPLPHPPEVAEGDANEGMEAAALLRDGRLLLLTEGQRTPAGDIRGWLGVLDGAGAGAPEVLWRPLSLEPTGAFAPTGAAALPSGGALLLERSYSDEEGIRVRLSEIAARDIAPGARLAPRELARLEPPMTVDNMEAVAVREGPGGGVLIYLLSDDNFSDSQRTLLLQLELPP